MWLPVCVIRVTLFTGIVPLPVMTVLHVSAKSGSLQWFFIKWLCFLLESYEIGACYVKVYSCGKKKELTPHQSGWDNPPCYYLCYCLFVSISLRLHLHVQYGKGNIVPRHVVPVTPLLSKCVYRSWDYICPVCVCRGTCHVTRGRRNRAGVMMQPVTAWPPLFYLENTSRLPPNPLAAPLTQMCHQLHAESEECCLKVCPCTQADLWCPPATPPVPQEFRCIVTERHALPMTVTHRVAIASQLCSRPLSRNWGDVNTFYFIHLVYWLLHAAKRPSDFICNRAGHQSLWRQKEVGTTGVYSYKSDSSLSEQLGNKYIDMICVWVSVRVITGLKQWALLAFKVTRAVVWVL